MKYSKSNPPMTCMMTQSTCYKGTKKMTVKGGLLLLYFMMCCLPPYNFQMGRTTSSASSPIVYLLRPSASSLRRNLLYSTASLRAL